jgi:hypothetical protein
MREQRIAERAYEIYKARGAADGCDLDDWLQAEREVLTAEQAAVSEISVAHEPPVPSDGADPAVLAEELMAPAVLAARR